MTANIGIIGRARVGKDTAGAWLCEHRGYVRVAFADAVRDVALRTDPIVSIWPEPDGEPASARLSQVIEWESWDAAKDQHPEVRRILQETGMAIRAHDPDFWLRIALDKTKVANDAGHPVVITDVRFPNEAESLKRAGFALVYIDRPGVEHLDHASEGALTSEDAHYTIHNVGTVDDLHGTVRRLVDGLTAIESRLHYGHPFV
jgi:deoxynucleotide monophosphate kinase-like protein